MKHKGYNNVTSSNGNSVAQKKLFNGKEFQDELGLNWHDFGWRNHDASLGRWMNIDNAADEYVRWSPYSYSMNNPIFFIDPDGQRIKIGDSYYSYEKDRNYDAIEDEFERDAYKSLDRLYSSGAMEITFGEGDDAKTINILDELIKDERNTISIFKGKEGGGNGYSNDNITYDPTHGAMFYKDASKPFSGDNIGRMSASASLGHELVHAYNDNNEHFYFVVRGYDDSTKGKIITSDKNKFDVSFPNREEAYTTTLSNQINEKLGEDSRSNYGLSRYRTESPTSVKPKQVKKEVKKQKK